MAKRGLFKTAAIIVFGGSLVGGLAFGVLGTLENAVVYLENPQVYQRNAIYTPILIGPPFAIFLGGPPALLTCLVLLPLARKQGRFGAVEALFAGLSATAVIYLPLVLSNGGLKLARDFSSIVSEERGGPGHGSPGGPTLLSVFLCAAIASLVVQHWLFRRRSLDATSSE